MYEGSVSGMPADRAALLEAGVALGQNHAFGLIAGRCSAAQAEGIRRLREQKLYKSCTENWDEFCSLFLKISRSEADKIIRLWEEFGASYFELTQLTRVSPETYRLVAPAIQNGALHYDGEAIELNPENSRKVAAVVAELRRAAAKPSAGSRSLLREVQSACHEADLTVRIEKLNECGTALAAEFENISRDEGLGTARMLLNSALANVRSELGRVAAENGLA